MPAQPGQTSHQYAQAHAMRVDWMTEEMLAIADDATNDWALDKEGNPAGGSQGCATLEGQAGDAPMVGCAA